MIEEESTQGWIQDQTKKFQTGLIHEKKSFYT